MMTTTLERPRTNSVDWEHLADRIFSRKKLNLRSLSAIQRIILTTDGTLTDILEIYLLESIQVVKLKERPLYIEGDNPLEVDEDMEVTERKILLQGKESGKNWLYAESIIINERLHNQFDQGLKKSSKPIGKLWAEHKVETYKDTMHCFEEPAVDLAGHFHVSSTELLMCRTYRVFSQRQPVMMITEKFPESFYTCTD